MGVWHAANYEALGVWATAVVTGGLWYYTARLWKTTQRSVTVAQQAAEGLPLIERAYVYISLTWDPSEIQRIPEIESVLLHVKYELSNYGRTPARVTIARITPVFSESAPHELPVGVAWDLLPLNALLGSNEKPPNGFNSSGGRQIVIPAKGYDDYITPATADELAHEEHARRNLYLVGDYTFYDVLGEERVETFCFGPHGYRESNSRLNRPAVKSKK